MASEDADTQERIEQDTAPGPTPPAELKDPLVWIDCEVRNDRLSSILPAPPSLPYLPTPFSR